MFVLIHSVPIRKWMNPPIQWNKRKQGIRSNDASYPDASLMDHTAFNIPTNPRSGCKLRFFLQAYLSSSSARFPWRTNWFPVKVKAKKQAHFFLSANNTRAMGMKLIVL